MLNECELQEEESRERQRIISNGELKAKIKVNFGEIIDVRTISEYNANHIEGAISIPLEELESNLDKLDKNEEWNIICNTGEKTKRAGEILKKSGFKNVSMVLPGMSKW